jgi:hypothetical protein
MIPVLTRFIGDLPDGQVKLLAGDSNTKKGRGMFGAALRIMERRLSKTVLGG